MELMRHGASASKLQEMAKKTAAAVKGLWEPHEEKAFARGFETDKSKWDQKYFDSQEVYLDTNFSRKRFDHLAEVLDHLNK